MKRKITMRCYVRVIAALIVSAPVYQAVSAEERFDLEKVAQCVACHGADGKGKAAQYPDLQGKPAPYLLAQLEYFKSGLRKSSTMNVVAAQLSQEDMQMLAKFFSQVQ